MNPIFYPPNRQVLTPAQPSATRNRVLHGDCTELLRRMNGDSVDFILTDPPYLVRYRDRKGNAIANDDNSAWMQPAFSELFRVLKPRSFCVSFYGWSKADLFIGAWRKAGFLIGGHIVLRKAYASSSRYLRYEHEQAYLLTKGDAPLPDCPIPDVIDFAYTGNNLHPTQKPVSALRPLIEAFSRPDALVLDPFCGSGSTLVAARDAGRAYLGMELCRDHYGTAVRRLNGSQAVAA